MRSLAGLALITLLLATVGALCVAGSLVALSGSMVVLGGPTPQELLGR